MSGWTFFLITVLKNLRYLNNSIHSDQYLFDFTAGLWGAKVFMDRNLLKSVLEHIIDNATMPSEKNTKLRKYDDQSLLASHLVPVMNGIIDL